jgi:hypothetical protein
MGSYTRHGPHRGDSHCAYNHGSRSPFSPRTLYSSSERINTDHAFETQTTRARTARGTRARHSTARSSGSPGRTMLRSGEAIGESVKDLRGREMALGRLVEGPGWEEVPGWEAGVCAAE